METGPGLGSSQREVNPLFPDGPFPPSILAKIGNMQARTAKCLFQTRGACPGGPRGLTCLGIFSECQLQNSTSSANRVIRVCSASARLLVRSAPAQLDGTVRRSRWMWASGLVDNAQEILGRRKPRRATHWTKVDVCRFETRSSSTRLLAEGSSGRWRQLL